MTSFGISWRDHLLLGEVKMFRRHPESTDLAIYTVLFINMPQVPVYCA
jgi:hypothetical protein